MGTGGSMFHHLRRLSVSLILISNVFGFQSVQEGVWVRDVDRSFLSQIKRESRWTVDHLNSAGYEVYGPRGLRQELLLRGVPYSELRGPRDIEGYPTFEDYEKSLRELHQKYPQITSLFSIGKSGADRSLWVLKISDSPEVDQMIPEVKLISSMHGDEITGREVFIRFIAQLLADYSAGDVATKNLINNTELFFMPSMNPDGSMAKTRGNSVGADLNRDFPDFSTADSIDSATGRQPETRAVMKFQADRHFALSANFHGGAEVVNYMWDALLERHPLDSMLQKISRDYADRVSYLRSSSEFKNGITNGFDWYQVNGGMQDWSYHWYGDTQFTIEISGVKWPAYSEMDFYFRENKKALFKFLKNVHQGAGFRFKTAGISGFVKISKQELLGTKEIGEFPFSNSEFYKILEPGDYIFEVRSEQIAPTQFEMKVLENRIFKKGNMRTLISVGTPTR